MLTKGPNNTMAETRRERANAQLAGPANPYDPSSAERFSASGSKCTVVPPSLPCGWVGKGAAPGDGIRGESV